MLKTYNGCGCTVKYKNKKELLGGVCKSCGQEFCGEHLFSYVDGNNRAITKNSPMYCEGCYIIIYEK